MMFRPFGATVPHAPHRPPPDAAFPPPNIHRPIPNGRRPTRTPRHARLPKARVGVRCALPNLRVRPQE